MDADARRFLRDAQEFLTVAATEWNEGRTWASGELRDRGKKAWVYLIYHWARLILSTPPPGFAHPLPFREEDRCKKKNCGEILGCQENLLICFVHPVLLVLRLAELAALGYGGWVIVAQVVKVRLVAVVAGLNSHLHAVFLHGKFSSLNLYVNIISSNSDLCKNFLLLKDKITLDFMEFLQVFKRF